MSARSLLPLLLPALFALGCSGSSEPAGTTAPPATTTTVSNRNIEMSTPDGQVSLSLDGRLPPGWPASFPLPPGTTPAGSGSLINGAAGGMVGVFRISGTAEDAFSFYRANPDAPVTDASSMGVGPAYVGRAKLTGPYEGSVNVGGMSGADLLVVVLRGPATPGTTTGTSGGTAAGSTSTAPS